MASSDQSLENSLEDLILFTRALMKRVGKSETEIALRDMRDLFDRCKGE